MPKTLLVMRQEISKTLHSAGYVIFAFVVPLVAVLIVAAVTFTRGSSGDGENIAAGAPQQSEIAVEGYVDQSSLIRAIPSNIPADRLRGYADEAHAQQALAAGEITAYYIVPPDVVQRGLVYYVYPDTRSYLADGQPWVMAWTLTVNLLGRDEKLADQVRNPAWNVTTTDVTAQSGVGQAGEDCSRPGAACQSNDLVRYFPSIMVAIFFATFMISSSLLFNAVGVEKENRTLEVVLLAVSPRQLLAGKTLALGALGILQTVTWLAAMAISANLGGSTLRLPANFAFPVEILVWGVVFFAGGYGLYASLMAGAGALAPKMKEAGVANVIAMIPLLIGYMVGLMAPVAEVADAPLPVALSFFPFTAPVVMIMRLSNGVVPLWQLLLAAGLTYAAAWWALRAVARLFHAQNLLSGQPFSVSRYLGALFAGRAAGG